MLCVHRRFGTIINVQKIAALPISAETFSRKCMARSCLIRHMVVRIALEFESPMSKLTLRSVWAWTLLHKVSTEGALSLIIRCWSILGVKWEIVSVKAVVKLAAFGWGLGEVIKLFCGGFSLGGEDLNHEILYNYLHAWNSWT